jgi:sigma-54 dependent transcriptional regulator, flagellar regulatory protein
MRGAGVGAGFSVFQGVDMSSASARGVPAFVGESDSVRAIRNIIPVVAVSNSTVLITGESGTGKEIVARSLHVQSHRASGNFVPINCAAIPKELLESELFGHRKGAFTGAITDRMGRFELANGGSIFLDEIGDLTLELQVKLLRVLQERTIDPVGAPRAVAVDVRVIAATHRDLEAEIAAGRFREDLYYRLNVLPLNTPTLRERVSDIPLLLDYFAKHHAAQGQAPITFSPDFLRALQSYQWPGNVRELSNLIDRFSTLFAGERLALSSVTPSLLPKGLAALQSEMGEAEGPDNFPLFDAPAEVNLGDDAPHEGVFAGNEVEQITFLSQGMPVLPPEGLSLKHRLAEIERDLISQALSRANGNVSQTARILNLQRTTLIEKIQKFGLRAG